MLTLIIFLIIFLALLYFTSRYWKHKLLGRPSKALYPYSNVKGRIIIGKPANKPSYFPKSKPLSIYVNAKEGNSHSRACVVCGRSSQSYSYIHCINPMCSRVYHPKCLDWIKKRGRRTCSCGTKLPVGVELLDPLKKRCRKLSEISVLELVKPTGDYR